jgi:ABC-type molybdenum transport system ATPase subunit/photorepair protein PhrA
MTHRPEELVDAIQHFSYWEPQQQQQQQQQPNDGSSYRGSKCSPMSMKTEDRNGRSGMELFTAALNLEPEALLSYNWDDENVPSVETIQTTWWRINQHHHQKQRNNGGDRWSSEEDDSSSSSSSFSSAIKPDVIVETHNLSIHRGEVTLLHNLNWTVARGERWLVGGGNGAGKSTLSRLLARPDTNERLHQQLQINGRIGWVSTERHLEMAKSADTVLQVLTTNHFGGAASDKAFMIKSATEVATWLGVIDAIDRPFCLLSQGEQKLVLIGAALACQPDLLVLDEPCQGLDSINRQRVLALVERICRATDMSLVYITHHLEELLPTVSHALHLKDQRAVYQGPVADYNPKDL